MTREQMKSTMEDLVLIEKDLMRELSEEESNEVINKGFASFMNGLSNSCAYNTVNSNDWYPTLRAVRKIISVFMTENSEEFYKLINYNTFSAEKVFTILAEILKQQRLNTPEVKKDNNTHPQTVINLHKDNILYDHGYKEDDDLDLSKNFSPEETALTEKTLGIYNPNNDKGIDDRLKAEKETRPTIDIHSCIKKLEKGRPVFVNPVDYNIIKDYLFSHYNKVSIKYNNGALTATFN